jgi:hypothetical protein
MEILFLLKFDQSYSIRVQLELGQSDWRKHIRYCERLRLLLGLFLIGFLFLAFEFQQFPIFIGNIIEVLVDIDGFEPELESR